MTAIAILIIIGTLITLAAFKWLPVNFLSNNRSFVKAASVVTLAALPLLMLCMFDLPWDEPLFKMGLKHLLLNYVICALILLFFICIAYKPIHGIYLAIIVSASFGVANAEVIGFRFYPIAPVDILSVRTAAAVAGGYQIFCTRNIALTFIMMFVCIIWTGLLNKAYHCNRGDGSCDTKAITRTVPVVHNLRRARYLIAIFIVCILASWINLVDFYDKYDMEYKDWDPLFAYKDYGLPLTFTAQIHTMFPDLPEGYSAAKADEIISTGAESLPIEVSSPEATDEVDKSQSSPVVLAIMNESFTDFDMLGKLDCNKEYLKNYYALKDDPGTLEWGCTYTSTYGGGTYKSEFEYLTGSAMANIPGTIPYMMFDFTKVSSLVEEYKAEGYKCVAAHAFLPTDWRRDRVYADMGFDKFLDIRDFDREGKIDSRGYLSDEGNYERMIEEIKNTDEPLFLFNVTIQNHGGYTEGELPGVAVDVDPEYNGYEDFRIFAGDMKKSDEALKYLLDELRKMERPVTVAFFGDHQPSLDTECLDILLESEKDTASNDAEFAQRKYITPYFIWTNHNSLPLEGKPTDEVSIITPTYLGVATRYYAGCELTDFDKYMLNLRSKLPMLNINGLYTDRTGFVASTELDTISDEEVNELLRGYSYVEYRRVYDK